MPVFSLPVAHSYGALFANGTPWRQRGSIHLCVSALLAVHLIPTTGTAEDVLGGFRQEEDLLGSHIRGESALTSSVARRWKRYLSQTKSQLHSRHRDILLPISACREALGEELDACWSLVRSWRFSAL